ncbi:hypothetical protein PF001_g6872 [Phytophthora fragariae]|uniref:Uncharacterized protein n=1 Tax=Phytophthora fragariae TaxID=53985 RepID=A0A6A4E746_9STRA|nr:hypothetical protein PF001_g6872 [Phytophthora fragariae]
MPLPHVELFVNVSHLPTVHCPGNHPSSPRNAKAAFPPSYCWAHANNQDPGACRAYITKAEAHMLSILRRHEWFDEAMDELQARDLEASMERVELTDEEEESKQEAKDE